MSLPGWWFKTHDFIDGRQGCVYCGLTKNDIISMKVVCGWKLKVKKNS